MYQRRKSRCPLQTYFRINNENTGQFERTLTSWMRGKCSLCGRLYKRPIQAIAFHAAIVEIFALDGAYMRYTTIQNWSDNVYNLVTKASSKMPLLSGSRELRAKTTMKYPSVYLDGEGACGTMLSIAFANAGQHQDTGASDGPQCPHTQPVYRVEIHRERW